MLIRLDLLWPTAPVTAKTANYSTLGSAQ